MQAVIDNSARPGILMQFARRRDYMMRSEKRGGYNQGGSSAPNNRGRRPRRRKAGFFYIFFALLLSVLFWPIGMIMLWRRKVRWRITTKLITSIVTLFLCVTLVGFGLTVQTDYPAVTKVQDSVNDFLDHSVEYTADAYSYICEKSVQVYESAADLGDGLGRIAMISMADAIDESTELAAQARDFVVEKVAALKAKDETVEPSVDATAEPGTAEAAPTENAEAVVPTEVTEAPEATEAATEAPIMTEEPAAAPVVVSEGELPVGIPESTPDSETAQPIGEGDMNRDRELTSAAPAEVPSATEAPAAEVPADEVPASEAVEAAAETPAATAEVVEATETVVVTATPEVTEAPAATVAVIDPDLMPKPAGEAVVYYNSNGVNYHMASSCKNMGSAHAGTLADAVEKGLRRCKNCLTPDASILDAENVVWIDESGNFHLYDDCAEFNGKWSLMTLSDALAAGNVPCAACQAGLYMAACGEALPTPTPEPTPEPTPTPVPTPTPEPVTVTPSAALKPVGEALVYHSSNGGWYHTEPDCSGMSGADLYPLSECYKTHKRCRKCEAPLPELMDEHCLWQDDQSTCHTTDECPAFTGKYTLVIRDEALAAGMTGCTVCGAVEYLQPNTLIAYPAQ